MKLANKDIQLTIFNSVRTLRENGRNVYMINEYTVGNSRK